MLVTRRVAALVGAALLLSACGTGDSERSAPVPAVAPVAAVPVDLPAGAEPEALAVSNGTVLVGFRRAGRPGLLRRTPGGALTELPTRPSTGYGATASWYALAADGDRVLAVGGDRGGAHGNVRWSAWSGSEAGSAAGIAEHTQAFTTFGGWGAGDLVGAVFTDAGPVLVGSWESAAAGDDVAVWTATGDEWARASSAGTALASTRTTLNFAVAATRAPGGVLVAGWRAGTGGQAPAVWQERDGAQWVVTPLPDGGRTGTAQSATCGPVTCAVAGRVDGLLAMWRLAGGRWSQVAGLPPIGVGDLDPLAAPLVVDDPVAGDSVVQVAADGDRVVAIDVPVDGATSGVTVRPIDAGPVTGPVREAVAAGPDGFVLAGVPARLWRVPGLGTP